MTSSPGSGNIPDLLSAFYPGFSGSWKGLGWKGPCSSSRSICPGAFPKQVDPGSRGKAGVHRAAPPHRDSGRKRKSERKTERWERDKSLEDSQGIPGKGKAWDYRDSRQPRPENPGMAELGKSLWDHRARAPEPHPEGSNPSRNGDSLSCRCPIPGSASGHPGKGAERPGIAERDRPSCSRIRWNPGWAEEPEDPRPDGTFPSRDFWEEAGPAPSPAPRSHPGAGIPSRWEARLRQPQGNSEGSQCLPFPSESIKKSSGKIPPAPGGQRRARGKELSPITQNWRRPPARIPDYPALISPPGSRRLHPPSPPCQKPGKKGPAALPTLPKELSHLFPLPLPKESKMAAREEREAIPRSCGSKAGSERVPGN